MEEKPEEETNPGSNFFSFPGSRHVREEESRTSHSWFHRTLSPCQLSPPTRRLSPQLSFGKRSAHRSLALFLLVLKESAEAQNRGENGVLLCLVLRAPLSRDRLGASGAKALSANSARHRCLPGCQHNPGSLLLDSWGEPIPRELSCSFSASPASPPIICSYRKDVAAPRRLAKRQLGRDTPDRQQATRAQRGNRPR